MRRLSTATRALLLLASMFATMPALAHAQHIDALPFRPIRIDGYWNRDRSAPKVLEGMNFVDSRGGSPRVFGVTALQAYKPEEEGVQVLRHGSGPIRLLGSEDLVRKFMDAPEQQRVVAYGVYRPGANTLTLNSVEVGHGS